MQSVAHGGRTGVGEGSLGWQTCAVRSASSTAGKEQTTESDRASVGWTIVRSLTMSAIFRESNVRQTKTRTNI